MRAMLLPILTLVGVGAVLTAQPPTASPPAAINEMNSAHDKCARACADCMLMCEHCAMHCTELADAGKKEHRHFAAICCDCAAICATSAQLTARHGPLGGTLCTACKEACEKCAAACAKFPDDAMMAKCATVCRECAKACATMTMAHKDGNRS